VSVECAVFGVHSTHTRLVGDFMLVRAFSMVDSGFEALLQLSPDFKLLRVKGITAAEEDFWRDRIADVVPRLEVGVSFSDGIGAISRMSGLYTALRIDPMDDHNMTDDEFLRIFRETLRTYGVTTGEYILKSRSPLSPHSAGD
jgi:hypothetical protein